MKRKQLLGFAVAGLLVLSGCQSKVQDDGKDVIASIQGKNITADDVYKNLSTVAGSQGASFTFVLDQLVNEKFPVTSDMKENTNEMIENIETTYDNQYGDEADTQLESALASAGYKNMDDYKQDIIYSLQRAEFLKKYVKDNFDEVFDDYYQYASPRYMSLIKVSMSDVENPTDQEQEKLDEVKSLLKTDKSFEDIASDYSDDDSASAKGNIGIVDTSSALATTYGSDVLDKALALKTNEISEPIKGTDGYYILKCTGNDKETIKNELKNVDIDSPLLAYDQYMSYLAFQTYEFSYDDETFEKQINKIIDDALKARDEARGGNE